MGHEHNPDFIHHQKSISTSLIREIVFGMEDGMVSTMGAITGIAVGTRDHFIIVLSGLVIISVESISMAVGSYLSSKSEREIEERKLGEERIELQKFPKEEEKELEGMYIKDGWPKELAGSMAKAASKNKHLFLQEMAYRELKIIPEKMEHPLQNGVAMGIAYIIGGAIPLFPYLVMSSLSQTIFFSVGVGVVGLFVLGAVTAKFSKRTWWKAGFEMFALASAAALIGYLVGQAVDQWWVKK
ncbi:MAG: hypothetical protein A2754_03045 [Candidatus Magasanikbacteria bacterium RIFCSPHIGHO2_01_FULL_47_8]|uniref:Iron transporter n=1 Tax=Candidatus Magasanikbacteria bacterium RIFCSPHIGHO2_01_FULL_47_8 TaxID=1798673 RepID=A0A1F6MD39_9BACT|nr:MAG: hypothetical protein A2754_03045 [Candidatus Magasanikbacteria bacterium RIFCSPHIGHO2_01_FULL_47_8]